MICKNVFHTTKIQKNIYDNWDWHLVLYSELKFFSPETKTFVLTIVSFQHSGRLNSKHFGQKKLYFLTCQINSYVTNSFSLKFRIWVGKKFLQWMLQEDFPAQQSSTENFGWPAVTIGSTRRRSWTNPVSGFKVRIYRME